MSSDRVSSRERRFMNVDVQADATALAIFPGDGTVFFVSPTTHPDEIPYMNPLLRSVLTTLLDVTADLIDGKKEGDQ